ncbi:PAS domain-containing sensor histidine kinase [Zobellia sp. 1_MG-2023]|uniref:PAS domain-containing sensor histidine kinase n=1 Tax=Zobellia sp. 1_MG-2023 TaxID=3062626 RepID=UPI0026E3BA3D|nr:PAS domain-containing sensor histidine kinase [Zobellia sp. 1_MG-2023]MDO6821023.1 PAS domain S-box protein [Zobellia sp. 1_MG-2023]
MDSSKEIELLKKALERQKKARQQAEKILEQKSTELYETAQRLKEANGKLENLLTEKVSELDGVFVNIIDPYVVMDLQANVIKMNTSAKDFLGYDNTKEDVNLTGLVHKKYLQYTAESFKYLLEVGTLKNYRAKINVKNGDEKWIEINSSLIYNTKQEPIGAQGIIRDITQEMEIKELLAQQRKQLDVIVENSPLGIVLSVGGEIIKANTTFTELLGYSESELKTMKLDDFSKEEESSGSEDVVQQMQEGKTDKAVVIKRYFKKGGGCLVAKTSVSAVRGGDGKLKYLLAMIEDITREREAEERLRYEREKYANIIANMNLGLVEVDTDDVIQLVNQSFCNMSGFKEEELLGKKGTEMLRVQNKNVLEHEDEKRMRGESDSYELEVIDKSGKKKHWLVSGAPRYDNDKKLIGSVGIHLDITKQKLLELQKEQLVKELEQSNQGLQEYAHIVSHDLKSPLRSISALATWIQDDYKDVLDEAGQQNLTLMQEKVASMDKLIQGILEYSTANNSELDNSSVDLNEVVENIKESIFIPEHVSLVVPKVLPTIVADSTKMHQLFQNILSNAVVHIEKEVGLVEVLYVENTTHWQFSIKDNGVGIPKEYHKKIFEIFQSIGANERSTGIGLSIVKKIIDRYEGEVWVESEKDMGTEFHFTIKKEPTNLNS